MIFPTSGSRRTFLVGRIRSRASVSREGSSPPIYSGVRRVTENARESSPSSVTAQTVYR